MIPVFSYKQLDHIRKLQQAGDIKGATEYKRSLINNNKVGMVENAPSFFDRYNSNEE